MKKLLLAIVILSCLASVIVVPSAAEATSVEVAYFANNVQNDTAVWQLVYPRTSERMYLTPGVTYYLQSTAFIATEEGNIPDGLLFVDGSKVYRINYYQAIPGYYVLEPVPDPDDQFVYDPGRYRALSVFASDSSESVYDAGFSAGYMTGFNDGIAQATGSGYDDGYAEGYEQGNKEGYAQGLNVSQTGDWRSLISAVVEAPVNTIQALFNFEILGLDMRLAFGSMLSICVFLIVLKKVVM